MPSRTLAVYLGETFVGNLTQLIDGSTFLAFDERYIADTNRPTLSLSYKNVLNNLTSTAQRASSGLPPFFSNLLPEGALRKYLAEKSGIRETQEYRLLTALKDDLPGAVLLKNEDGTIFEEINQELNLTPAIDQPLRFSLAGIQLKFSGDLSNSKLVIPSSGVGGHWIVKLPSPAYPNVTELEYSMLLLASKIGIIVPEFRLLPTAHLENLPSDLPEMFEGDCLISKRFDRTLGGARIHMEDFAQVFAIRDKYDPAYNYQSIANVLWIESGLESVLELVRRLVHMIVTGNGDMHLKNWSLIYPDERQPKLAPAYDFVSTKVYSGIEPRLALKMAGTREFGDINIDTFKKFAKIVKLPERPVVNTVIETVDAIKEWWPKLRRDFGIPESFKRLIEEHMESVPLFYERATLIAPAAPIPLANTWPGSFFNTEIKLDEHIPASEIVFKNYAGKKITKKAPRRMVNVLLNKLVHQLVAENSDFANQNIEAYVGLSLYDEWRLDSFIRIQSRLVKGGIDEQILQRNELNLNATFFPFDWRELENLRKAKEQTFKIDFELANGEIWCCECTLGSIENVELHPDGRRTAEIRLYKRKADKLFTLPQKERNRLGSSKFSIPQNALSTQEPKFSGYVHPWHTAGELSITLTEDDEEAGEYRYKTKHFETHESFMQCLREIGVPEDDLPNLQPDAFNRTVRLKNIDLEPLTHWGLLEKLIS